MEAIHRDPWTFGPDLDEWWRVTAGAGTITAACSAAACPKNTHVLVHVAMGPFHVGGFDF